VAVRGDGDVAGRGSITMTLLGSRAGRIDAREEVRTALGGARLRAVDDTTDDVSTVRDRGTAVVGFLASSCSVSGITEYRACAPALSRAACVGMRSAPRFSRAVPARPHLNHETDGKPRCLVVQMQSRRGGAAMRFSR
jgi:hypothetical protein